jgi:hypothetical protein
VRVLIMRHDEGRMVKLSRDSRREVVERLMIVIVNPVSVLLLPLDLLQVESWYLMLHLLILGGYFIYVCTWFHRGPIVEY